MRDAAEGAQAGAHVRRLQTAHEARGRRRHRVLDVVAPPQRQLGDLEQRALAPPQATVVLAQIKAAAAGEGHLAHAGQQREHVRRRDREVLLALAREQLELGRQIRLHRLVAIEVIGRHVEQHADLGREAAGVLQLKGGDLARDRGIPGKRSHERAQGGAHVARHRHRVAGLPVDVADELDRRRLAVGAGDGDELVSQQAPRELELAQNAEPARARRRDHRCRIGHSGTLDERSHALKERLNGGLAEPQLDSLAGQRSGLGRLSGVVAGDARAARPQRVGGGDARASKAGDEVWPGRKLRALGHAQPMLWR